MVVEFGRAGLPATLVCRAGPEARVMAPARSLGVSHIETLHLASGVSPLADARDLARLGRWLREAHVVHVHRGKEHWLAALSNGRRGRPLVRTRHIVQPVRAHALNRWLYGRATDLVVTVTEAIRRQYLAGGLLPAERVVALPGGVDAQAFVPEAPGRQAFRQALAVPATVPLVGLLGGFRVMKGHQVAVEAAARLAGEGRGFHLVMIGRGPLRAQVSEAVQAAGLGRRVSIVEQVDRMPAALAALDIALYPALESDGMSRVLWEYLAAGCAVVASRVGVVPEVLVDGHSALLVPAGEPCALAGALERLLDDADLRSRLGRAGRALVESRCSGERIARELAAHYARLWHGQAREAR
jgi:glycosyltransferase involved in cell wall biosynthesis